MYTMEYFKKPRNLNIFIILSLSFVAFLVIGGLLRYGQVFTYIDPLFFQLLGNQSHPLISDFFISFTNIMSPIIFSLISFLLFLFLAFKKRWFYSLFLVLSVISGSLLFLYAKSIFLIERPLGQLLLTSGNSFPSGHATLAVIFFTLVFFSFKDYIKNRFTRVMFGILCTFFVFLVGLSRIYIHVHRLSDVLAGFLLGIVVVSFLYLILDFLFSLRSKK